MQGKLKVVLIVMLVLLTSACNVFRRASGTEPAAGTAVTDYSVMMATVTDNNITGIGFEIRKGSIELEGTQIEGKFGLHARLNSHGDFYGSVRGPLGIELARVLIVGNDIAAIDRFNRTIYIGEKDAVMKKNGLPEDFMTILFGDMPKETRGDFRSAGNNQITVTAGDDSFRRELTICTTEMKVCSEKIDARETGHSAFLSFGSFRNTGGKTYASVIVMEEKKKMFHVKLTIDDLKYGYDSPIEYNLPPYERENL